jgi:hypothetical protein
MTPSSLASLGGGGAAMHPDLPNKVIESTQRAKPCSGLRDDGRSVGSVPIRRAICFWRGQKAAGLSCRRLEGKVINEGG